MERASIYRKCRLEEVELPFKKGDLSDIPIDEVYSSFLMFLVLCLILPFVRQNIRDDMAMDVDGDPDNTQRPKEVDDYGLVLDYSKVDIDDLEVCFLFLCSFVLFVHFTLESSPRR